MVREVLEQLDRLAARRVVIEEVRDLLTLEVSAQLLLGEVHRGRRLRPVRRGDREDIRIALSVGGGGAAEARRRARDAVLRELRGERVDMRRAVDGDADRPFLLVALVRLDARRDLVLVVDLDRLDLVPFDPALAVHEGDVVVETRAEHRADDLRRTGTVALDADDDLGLGLGVGLHDEQTARRQHQSGHDSQITLHCFLLPAYLSTRTAKRGSRFGCSATDGSGHRAPRSGTR